ncbi:thioredoxin [Brevibacillus laterosporus]|uniref:thioredoxin n=1 Tax=Brevibacillus laterosporus TaxID=1465 RepID=UPI00264A53FA|nr:thioredoxin [Brevibacillus laterosporus]MDN9010118.1 thioredoxin [Brevibacillus laterosporus]MDO0941372.1 thioredoxin [Brevibacillus laterosporus]
MTICHSMDITFKSDLKSEGFTLVNFWAPWCGPCGFFGSVFEEFDREYSNEVRLLKVNADEETNTANHFGIMSIPTTILFKDGEPIDKIVGAVPLEKLKQFIADKKDGTA